MNASALNYILKRGSFPARSAATSIDPPCTTVLGVGAPSPDRSSCTSDARSQLLLSACPAWCRLVCLMESAKFIHSKSVVKVQILGNNCVTVVKSRDNFQAPGCLQRSARCLALSKTSKTCCYPLTGIEMREGAVRSHRQN